MGLPDVGNEIVILKVGGFCGQADLERVYMYMFNLITKMNVIER